MPDNLHDALGCAQVRETDGDTKPFEQVLVMVRVCTNGGLQCVGVVHAKEPERTSAAVKTRAGPAAVAPLGGAPHDGLTDLSSSATDRERRSASHERRQSGVVVHVGPAFRGAPVEPRPRCRSIHDVLAQAFESTAAAGIDQLVSLHWCMMVETTGRPASNPSKGKRRRS